jgi:hypothetical protein
MSRIFQLIEFASAEGLRTELPQFDLNKCYTTYVQEASGEQTKLNFFPLDAAILFRRLDVYKLLLQHGADPERFSATKETMWPYYTAYLGEKSSPLQRAAIQGLESYVRAAFTYSHADPFSLVNRSGLCQPLFYILRNLVTMPKFSDVSNKLSRISDALQRRVLKQNRISHQNPDVLAAVGTALRWPDVNGTVIMNVSYDTIRSQLPKGSPWHVFSFRKHAMSASQTQTRYIQAALSEISKVISIKFNFVFPGSANWIINQLPRKAFGLEEASLGQTYLGGNGVHYSTAFGFLMNDIISNATDSVKELPAWLSERLHFAGLNPPEVEADPVNLNTSGAYAGTNYFAVRFAGERHKTALHFVSDDDYQEFVLHEILHFMGLGHVSEDCIASIMRPSADHNPPMVTVGPVDYEAMRLKRYPLRDDSAQIKHKLTGERWVRKMLYPGGSVDLTECSTAFLAASVYQASQCDTTMFFRTPGLNYSEWLFNPAGAVTAQLPTSGNISFVDLPKDAELFCGNTTLKSVESTVACMNATISLITSFSSADNGNELLASPSIMDAAFYAFLMGVFLEMTRSILEKNFSKKSSDVLSFAIYSALLVLSNVETPLNFIPIISALVVSVFSSFFLSEKDSKSIGIGAMSFVAGLQSPAAFWDVAAQSSAVSAASAVGSRVLAYLG